MRMVRQALPECRAFVGLVSSRAGAIAMTREEGEGGRGEDLRDLSATTLSWFRPEKVKNKKEERKL